MSAARREEIARLQHDAAVATARAILDVVAPCLRPEEQPDAYEEFLCIVSAGLAAYEERIECLRRPGSVGPSVN